MIQRDLPQVGRNGNKQAVLPQTILVGLGNPILGDDGIGWRVVQEVGRWFETHRRNGILPSGYEEVELDYLSLGGLSLMERLIGYTQAVLVDSIVTGKEPVGSVFCFELADLPTQSIGHLASAHDTSLQDAVEVGRRLGVCLPQRISIVAVETVISYDFCEILSPQADSAIPAAVSQVLALLADITHLSQMQ